MNMDTDRELVEDKRYDNDIHLDSISEVAKLFESLKECTELEKPKASYFCNYKVEKCEGQKIRLVPLRSSSIEPVKLTLKRVPSQNKLNDVGNWTVNLEQIPEMTLLAATAQKNTPSRCRPRKTINYEEDIPEEAHTPAKRDRKSAVKKENLSPCTPTTKTVLNRRKSILKTPSSGKVNSPRRSIAFSARVEEHQYEKKSANDKAQPFDDEGNELLAARKRLHVAAVPASLPCREKEFSEIYAFLEGNLNDEIGGCIYISGVPGTGKTATITEVIRSLQAEVEKHNLPHFDCVQINGMRITEPRKAYVEIYRQLTGKTVTWEQAYNLLDKRFTTPSPRRVTTILVVDELDILCNKRQDVVYNLLNWPNLNSARLIVVTIANTMDLPERVFMGKVSSRLGLTRLTFQPYSHKQLQEIVRSRLSGFDSFNSDAIQLVARKVAALSGDARRALDICRRATEIGEAEAAANSQAPAVTMSHVQQALSEMISCTKVAAIKSCSKMEKLFLQSVCMEVERTGIEEVIFRGVYNQLKSLVGINGLQLPTSGQALAISGRLSASRLLISEHCRKDIYQKILLNISADDFYYAVKLKQQD